MPTLLLITHEPNHPVAKLAVRYAESALQKIIATPQTLETEGELDVLEVFFYTEGAYTANALRWQPADQMDTAKEWKRLAETYKLDLAVCVSTALSRGITDADNAKRHQLTVDNLAVANIATGFRLVGLTELATKLNSHKIIQF